MIVSARLINFQPIASNSRGNAAVDILTLILVLQPKRKKQSVSRDFRAKSACLKGKMKENC